MEVVEVVETFMETIEAFLEVVETFMRLNWHQCHSIDFRRLALTFNYLITD